MTWVIPDHHNTGELNVDSVTLAVQRRRGVWRGVRVSLHGDNYPSFQAVQYEDRNMTWSTSLPGAGVLK
ncbi:hypothetical protein AB0A95_13370 [Micromonospora sp. NPDC049230]|uniref:hypothetical protein n=1 Tax=Micromonospora sp. NPDC049230 TaxID=3155502 RepID=UPI0033F930BC